VQIEGTDGMQFAPNVLQQTVKVFDSDVSRTLSFNYTGENLHLIKGFNTYGYTFDSDQYQNTTRNPANALFAITVDGTTNITSTF
jgi:hypothetical protein